MTTVNLWLRAGITINVTPEQAKKILGGDQETLEAALKPKGFWGFLKRKPIWHFDGDSYIPDEVATELREQLGIIPDECSGEVNFDL